MHLDILPTMIETANLEQLIKLRDGYIKVGDQPSSVAFMVLRSKENDFMAYFHEAKQKASLKDTVEWMQYTDNLTFPSHVSIKQGIMQRYDEKFHSELESVISEVIEERLSRRKIVDNIEEYTKIMAVLENLCKDLPPLSKAKIK